MIFSAKTKILNHDIPVPVTVLVAELEETREVPEALLARLTPTGTVDKFVAAFLSSSKRLLKQLTPFFFAFNHSLAPDLDA